MGSQVAVVLHCTDVVEHEVTLQRVVVAEGHGHHQAGVVYPVAQHRCNGGEVLSITMLLPVHSDTVSLIKRYSGVVLLRASAKREASFY